MFSTLINDKSSHLTLPNDKILDCSNLKSFAGNKMKVLKKIIVLDRVENIERKGEKSGYQQFHLFPKVFLKGSLLRATESLELWYANAFNFDKSKILLSGKVNLYQYHIRSV